MSDDRSEIILEAELQEPSTSTKRPHEDEEDEEGKPSKHQNTSNISMYHPSEIVPVVLMETEPTPIPTVRKGKSKMSTDQKVNAYSFVKNLICASITNVLDTYEYSSTVIVPETPCLPVMPLELVLRHILIKTQELKYLFLVSGLVQYIIARPHFSEKVLMKETKKQDAWSLLAANPSYTIKDTNSIDYMAENLIRVWDLKFTVTLPTIPQQFEVPQLRSNTKPPAEYCLVNIPNNRLIYLIVTKYFTFMIENGIVAPLNKALENCIPYFLGFDLSLQESEYCILEVVVTTNKLYIVDILDNQLGNYEDRLNYLQSRVRNKSNEICTLENNGAEKPATNNFPYSLYKSKGEPSQINYIVPNTAVGVVVGMHKQNAVLTLLREPDSDVLEYYKLVSPISLMPTLMFHLNNMSEENTTAIDGKEYEICECPNTSYFKQGLVVAFTNKFAKFEPTFKDVSTTASVEKMFKEAKSESSIEAAEAFILKSGLTKAQLIEIFNKINV